MTSTRGIWSGTSPLLTPPQLARAEIDEAFASAQTWRHATPAERSSDLYADAVAALTTLCCWGWHTTMAHTPTGWMVTASRTVDAKPLKAQAKHPRLIDAIADLGEKLSEVLAILAEPPKSRGGRPRKLEEAA
ncbi:MAG: hypothetical protein QM753_08730 [Thermomicrobiales bacterium]